MAWMGAKQNGGVWRDRAENCRSSVDGPRVVKQFNDLAYWSGAVFRSGPVPRLWASAIGQASPRFGPEAGGYRVGSDDVGQYLTGTYRGKLVKVADDQQRGMVGDRFKRSVGLRLELADRPHIAVSAVVHNLAGHLIGHETRALAVSAREIFCGGGTFATCLPR